MGRQRLEHSLVGVTLKAALTFAVALILAAPAALAQTAPDLFVFQPGTPIRADEMNANFQLLKNHITNALGIADLTTEEVAALAEVVSQIQELASSGDLDGISLEFAWDGASLGVRRTGQAEYTYVDLLGPAGPQGEAGPGLEFEWQGTQLGVRTAGDDAYALVDLVGPQGVQGVQGEQGLPGEPGGPGAPGPQGIPGEQGEAGPAGPAGAQGEPGPQGIQGVQGEPGEAGPAGPAGAAGEPGATGPQGPAGSVGPAGPQGERGPAGPAGPAGPEGPAGPAGPSGAMSKHVIRASTTIGTEDAFYLVLGAHEITLPANPAPDQMLLFHGNTAEASINFNGNYYMYGTDPGQWTTLNTFAPLDLSNRFYLYWVDSFWFWWPQ